VCSLRLLLPVGHTLRSLRLAGYHAPPVNLTSSAISITFYALHAAGELLNLVLAINSPVQLAVTSRSLGLPPGAGLPLLPATLVPAPGYYSFSTQVKQVFTL
jgi:hypothetical protein